MAGISLSPSTKNGSTTDIRLLLRKLQDAIGPDLEVDPGYKDKVLGDLECRRALDVATEKD